MDSNAYYSFNENSLPQDSIIDASGFDALKPSNPNTTDPNVSYSLYQNALLQPGYLSSIQLDPNLPFDFGVSSSLIASYNPNWIPHEATDAFSIQLWQNPTPSYHVEADGQATFGLNESYRQQSRQRGILDRARCSQVDLNPTTSQAFQPNGLNCAMGSNAFAHCPLLCDWPFCPSREIFTSLISRSHHVSKVHIAALLDNWPGQCTWPGCDSKATFTSRNLLETHVNNIHINPLLCTQSGCKHTRPFAKQTDLNRHLASVHKLGRTLRCPKNNCFRHEKGFPRKDKLRLHVNTLGHGAYHCQFDHCAFQNTQGLLSHDDVPKHESDAAFHGTFECAIGNCKDSKSHFNSSTLGEHLNRVHNTFFISTTWSFPAFLDGFTVTDAIFQIYHPYSTNFLPGEDPSKCTGCEVNAEKENESA